MKPLDLAKLSNSDLVDWFRHYALEKSEALLASDIPLVKRLCGKMEAIDVELRKRGPEARKSLLVLFDHKDLRVRYEAAIESLAVAPDEAIAVVRDVADSNTYPEAAEARFTLRALDEGIFKPT